MVSVHSIAEAVSVWSVCFWADRGFASGGNDLFKTQLGVVFFFKLFSCTESSIDLSWVMFCKTITELYSRSTRSAKLRDQLLSHWLCQTNGRSTADGAASVLANVGLARAVQILEQTNGSFIIIPHAWVANTCRTSAETLPRQSAQPVNRWGALHKG